MNQKLLLTLLFVLTCFGMAKAEVIQVGSGTGTISGPIYTSYNYCLSQQIYMPREINYTGTITSLALKTLHDPGMPREFDIYLVETNKNAFNDNYDYIIPVESDKVFSGSVAFVEGEWTTITFDKPFKYTCQKNLCLIVNDKTGSVPNNYNSYAQWLTFTGDAQTISRTNNDEGSYNPFAPTSIGATGTYLVQDKKCQLQLTFSDGTTGPYTTVQVGAGTATHTTLPSHTGHDHSYSQQIYTPAEIGQTGVISHLAFYASTCKSTPIRKVDIYLMKTNKNSFANVNDYLVPTESDKVFSGSVTFNLGEWTTIAFDTPFEYDGSENLCVIMNDKTGSCRYKAEWLAYSGVSGCSLSWYGLYNAYNPANPYAADAIDAYKSQILFTFIEPDNKEIGSGDGSSNYLPTYTYYNYSLTQQIYTKEELWKSGKDITSVSFFNTGEDRERNLDIYLVSTNKQGFTDDSDWINFTEDDKVFSGNVTFEQDAWTSIPFFKSWWYNGTGNVVLIVDDNTGTYQSEVPFRAFNASRQALYIYSDNINYKADGLTGYTGTIVNLKNQIRFNEIGLDLKPYDLTVFDIDYKGATITWKSAGSKWNLDYKTADATTWYHAVSGYSQTLTSPTYHLTGLAEETTFDIRVRTINDDGTYSEYVYTQFTTPQRFPRPTDVEVLAVTSFSAVVNWTENGVAKKWKIYLNDIPVADTDSKPYTLLGLKQGYRYELVVQPIIEMEDDDDPYYGNRSEKVVFFTPLVNPVPDVTSVTTTPASATITWEGKSDSYVVRYRTAATEEEVLFYDGFESGNFSTNGWITNRYGEGTQATDWQIVRAYHHNGSYAAASYCRDGDGIEYNIDNRLITPIVELGDKLEFWARNAGYTAWLDKFEVLLLPGSGTTAIELRPLQTSFTSWEKITVDLSEYKGTKGRIVFRHKDEKKSVLAIDDVKIYNSAKEAGEWQTIETTDKTVTIEGLEPDTEYEFEVVGIMQREEDSSSGVETFMTLSVNPVPYDIVTEPAISSAHISWTGYGDRYVVSYNEMHSGGIERTFFDDFASGSFDSKGWTVYTEGEVVPGKETGWYVTTSYSGSMAACADSYYPLSDGTEVPLNADNWLITPQVDLGGTLKFREWVRGQWPDEYEVLLSTTGKAIDDFTEVLRPLSPGEGAGTGYDGKWSNVELDLTAYAGQKGYIAIHHKCYNQFALQIDDFGIYQEMEEIGELHSVTVNETECTLEGLKPSTSYQFKITSHKSGESSAETDFLFFTTLNNPTDLVLDDSGNNTSTLTAYEGINTNVTISNRTFWKNGTWQGICLPFDVDVENSILAGADVRTLESCTQVGNEIYMNCLTPVTEMKAGTPYIIKWDGGTDIVNPSFESVIIDLADRDIRLDGGYGLGAYNRNSGGSSNAVYSSIECTSNQEYVCLMSGTSVLVPVTEDAGFLIHAFDIMFSVQDLYTEGIVVLLNTGEFNDIITGIKTTADGQQPTEIYNLAGMRLNKVQKGINIINGRKMIVK